MHDLAGRRDLPPTAGFDGVLHFAAFIAAGESVAAPEKYWENNVIGSLRLLDAIRAAKVPRLVFSSTANIYGSPNEQPIAETAVAAPPNPYATSKLAVEYAITGEATAHGLAAVRCGTSTRPAPWSAPTAVGVSATTRRRISSPTR